ncbi:MAG: helix-turn-helix transcriptional regulator [Oscillospiraceae bacterium]|nr:helix-turn-helix transcriptional regulator [Oscillospiraceae bacterium]
MSKLKAARERRGLTQKELARLADVSPRMVQNYEQGRADINRAEVLTVKRLADVLRVKIEDLIEDEKAGE